MHLLEARRCKKVQLAAGAALEIACSART